MILREGVADELLTIWSKIAIPKTTELVTYPMR